MTPPTPKKPKENGEKYIFNVHEIEIAKCIRKCLQNVYRKYINESAKDKSVKRGFQMFKNTALHSWLLSIHRLINLKGPQSIEELAGGATHICNASMCLLATVREQRIHFHCPVDSFLEENSNDID